MAGPAAGLWQTFLAFRERHPPTSVRSPRAPFGLERTFVDKCMTLVRTCTGSNANCRAISIDTESDADVYWTRAERILLNHERLWNVSEHMSALVQECLINVYSVLRFLYNSLIMWPLISGILWSVDLGLSTQPTIATGTTPCT